MTQSGALNILPHDIKSTFVGISNAVVLMSVCALCRYKYLAEAWHPVLLHMMLKAPCFHPQKRMYEHHSNDI